MSNLWLMVFFNIERLCYRFKVEGNYSLSRPNCFSCNRLHQPVLSQIWSEWMPRYLSDSCNASIRSLENWPINSLEIFEFVIILIYTELPTTIFIVSWFINTWKPVSFTVYKVSTAGFYTFTPLHIGAERIFLGRPLFEHLTTIQRHFYIPLRTLLSGAKIKKALQWLPSSMTRIYSELFDAIGLLLPSGTGLMHTLISPIERSSAGCAGIGLYGTYEW